MVWTCISLVTNDGEHLYLPIVCISFLEKCLLRSFDHFVTCLFSVELQVSIMYSRYKSHQIYDLQIFSPISWVGFSLCLLMHTILNFYVVQFFWFFFCCLLFWCHVQEIIAKELYCLSKTFQVPNFVLVSMGSDPVLDIFSFLVSMFILSVNVQLLIYVSTH